MGEDCPIERNLKPQDKPQHEHHLNNASCFLGFAGSGSPVGVLANEMFQIGSHIHQEEVDDERVGYNKRKIKSKSIAADLALCE